MDVLEALALLEQDNDEHWTNDGKPALAVVRELTEKPELTRAEITAAAPHFTRVSPDLTPVEVEVASVKVAEDAVSRAAKRAAEAQAAKEAAEALRDKVTLEVQAKQKPRHVLNMEAIRKVIEQSRKDRETRTTISALDHNTRIRNRTARRRALQGA